MYPRAPISRPNNIDYHACDTEMFMHLDKMMNGAPFPGNVIVDLDPYNSLPWNLPPSMLYFNSKNEKSLRGEQVHRSTEVGYWIVTGKDLGTLARSLIMGRKTTLEFYKGKAPSGYKTEWVMHEYEMDKLVGSSSLCRVFNRLTGNHFEEPPKTVADDADGELLEATLLSMLEHEEQDFSNTCQVVNGNEHGSQTISGSHLQNLRQNSIAQDLVEDFDFSGDYIEWNDISGRPSSSCSENTIFSSMTLDDCFDSDAVLRDLDTPIIMDTTKKENAACRFSVSASQGSHQVLIPPPPSAPLGDSGHSSKNKNYYQNSYVKGNMVYASTPSLCRGGSNGTRASVSHKELKSRKNSNQGSSACIINKVNKGLSSSQCSVPATAGCDKEAIGWIKKSMKKYCCFMCF